MSQWWINGLPGTQVDVTDRGFSYADGLFETIAIRSARPRFLALHLDRLFDGCERLGIAPPMSRSQVSEAMTAAANAVAHGVLKLVISRGTGPRGYAMPPEPKPTIAWGIDGSAATTSRPVALRWCETIVSVNRATAGLKTLARLEQVLARREWSDPAVAEGLMVNGNGRLVGGTASNVFLVVGDRLLTPALHDSGVAGVMRRAVIDTARRAGIHVVETDIRPALVQEATELFLTNALTGIRPVARVEQKSWAAGPLTRRLCQLMAEAGVEECAADH